MSDTANIGVLIPTRNCAALIPEHLESMRAWIDLADEVLVIDSESKDGTVEFIRSGLSHKNIRFLNHPPGLYQSWNFGIQNISCKYTYISTVGDSITRAGLEALLRICEKFQSDVTISKPAFIGMDGHALNDDQWPIDVIIQRLGISEPRLLSTAQQFFFAVTNTWGAILGSSASNLYRTSALQARPFPTEFGTAGDGGWGIQNIFDVKIAVTPDRFSSFRHHPKAYTREEYYVESLTLKLFRLAQTVASRQRECNLEAAKILDSLHWSRLEEALETHFVEQDKLESLRKAKFPWYLRFSGWRTRVIRNRARKLVDSIGEKISDIRQGASTKL